MKTRRKTGGTRKKPAARRERTVMSAIAAECTIAHARALKSRLARVLATRSCVTLDLSAVQRVDTAGMQVVAAFIRERRAAGRPLQCRGATEPFLVTARLLGLSALFTGPDGAGAAVEHA